MFLRLRRVLRTREPPEVTGSNAINFSLSFQLSHIGHNPTDFLDRVNLATLKSNSLSLLLLINLFLI
jgi:hypothetical protein